MVAGARHLSRADARRRRHAAEAMGRQPHLAGAAHRRRAAARRRDDEPRRVRQGGQGPLDRRAVRARLRRQQADHPAARQRPAERGAARPLALHHRSARPHLRRDGSSPDEAEQKNVVFELIASPAARPTRRSSPSCRRRSRRYAPRSAQRAQANPVIRANALMPAARFGVREEMKQAYGFGWREYVRGVTTTFDAVENLAFAERIKAHARQARRALPGQDRSPATRSTRPRSLANAERKMPDVIVVAANAQRRDRALLSRPARRPPTSARRRRAAPTTGFYDAAREGRMSPPPARSSLPSASPIAQATGRHALPRPRGAARTGSRAATRAAARRPRPARDRRFRLLAQPARSMNAPRSSARRACARLIDRFGFNMPPARIAAEATPPSTAAVLRADRRHRRAACIRWRAWCWRR